MAFDAKFWMVHPKINRVFPNSGMGCTRSNLAFIIWWFETQIYFILIIIQYSKFIFISSIQYILNNNVLVKL